jgi:hypothetical protein
MTRLGEFSPNGQLFTIESFSKITYKSSPNFVQIVLANKSTLLIIKTWFGLHIGRFLPTHPVHTKK